MTMAAAAAGDQHGAARVPCRAPVRVHPSSSNAASSSSSIFRLFCKGMLIPDDEMVGLSAVDLPGLPVLVVAVCSPQGEVVLRGYKPVQGFMIREHDDGDDGVVLLEAMALVEGLRTAVRLGITSVEAITDHRPLHKHILGPSRPTGEKLADVISQAQSVRKQFGRCEISLDMKGQLGAMVKLAKVDLDVEIARYLDVISHAQSVRKQFRRCEISLDMKGQLGATVKLAKEDQDVEIARYLATKNKRESCKICFDDVDNTKILAVEGCSHRFCVPCMKRHMEVMLLLGMAPRCPQLGCNTKLTVEEGSKVLLPSRLLEMMVQRLKEEDIHPSQRIYCPYPKCSALMSLSEVQAEGSSSCSDYNNAETLRKCVKCGEPMCVNCKVVWHEGMSCLEYQMRYPHGTPEDERLHDLARQRQWKQCERCNHMIEHTTGCTNITCVCGNYLCYVCGETLADDKVCACTTLADDKVCACTTLADDKVYACTKLARRKRRGCFPLLACCGGIRH